MIEVTNTPAAPAAIGPYSQAMKAGGFLFASGQVALTPGTGEVAGTTPLRSRRSGAVRA